MHRKCLGCGSLLQFEDEKKIGYIPVKKYAEADYCYRCFRLKNYHEYNIIDFSFENDRFLKKLNQFKKPVFYFLDLLNLNEESLTWFHNIQSIKILVISKVDLIPDTISNTKIEHWIRNIYSISEPILFVSSKIEKSLTTFYNYSIRHFYTSVLFAGMTNAGKSTFLNALAKHYNGTPTASLESEMPNTTLDTSKWNIGEMEIFDAPGFNYKDGILNTSKEFIQSINPLKHFKPITMQIKKEAGLVIDDICYFNQNEEFNSVTFYGSEFLDLKKIYKIPERFIDVPELKLNIPSGSDLVLKGIGFFYFKNYTKIMIRMANPTLIEVRKSIFDSTEE